MNANTELLNFIYQNSEMGVTTLEQLKEIVKGDDFRKKLKEQLHGYRDFHERARKLLNENGMDEKEVGTASKLSSYVMINMKTILDKSDSHIAEMIIQGSNMGIIDGIKKINQYEKEAEREIVNLMKKLVTFEEKNAEIMKEYLC